MSYYSNIRINLESEAILSFKRFLFKYMENNHIEKDYPFLDPELRFSVFYENKDHLYFGWDNYNYWNEYYDEPDLSTGVMKALRYLKKNKYAYEYVREGENYGDIETESSKNAKGKNVEMPQILITFDDEELKH